MTEYWTLTEGVQRLFADPDGPSAIEDLATEEHQLTLEVSFAVVEIDEDDGVRIEPMQGISVILTGFPPDDGKEHDDDVWMFSRVILPDKGEALPDLIQRIALGLGIQPDERIWYGDDGNSNDETGRAPA